jgi:hypothetical protein
MPLLFDFHILSLHLLPHWRLSHILLPETEKNLPNVLFNPSLDINVSVLQLSKRTKNTHEQRQTNNIWVLICITGWVRSGSTNSREEGITWQQGHLHPARSMSRQIRQVLGLFWWALKLGWTAGDPYNPLLLFTGTSYCSSFGGLPGFLTDRKNRYDASCVSQSW